MINPKYISLKQVSIRGIPYEYMFELVSHNAYTTIQNNTIFSIIFNIGRYVIPNGMSQHINKYLKIQ